jgi:hypothetical protein
MVRIGFGGDLSGGGGGGQSSGTSSEGCDVRRRRQTTWFPLVDGGSGQAVGQPLSPCTARHSGVQVAPQGRLVMALASLRSLSSWSIGWAPAFTNKPLNGIRIERPGVEKTLSTVAVIPLELRILLCILNSLGQCLQS